jgi:hypothetical protein
VVDQAPRPMSTLDLDMDELVHQAMEKLGIGGHTDAVVLGLGARAQHGTRDQARLPLGDHG